jgi:tetratricopeptide (TPR) repeat protein
LTYRKRLYLRLLHFKTGFLQQITCPTARLGRKDKTAPARGPRLQSLIFATLLSLPAAGLATPPSASYREALHQFQAGKFREASATLGDALRQTPLNAASELLLAQCYYRMGDWDRSILHAQSAVRLNPRSAESHLWLGQSYGRKAANDRSLALALKTRHEFERAVELGPTDLDARRDLMEFYLEAPWFLGGSKNKARQQAEAIAAINPAAGARASARLNGK